mgnify:CR=1 FL=1
MLYREEQRSFGSSKGREHGREQGREQGREEDMGQGREQDRRQQQQSPGEPGDPGASVDLLKNQMSDCDSPLGIKTVYSVHSYPPVCRSDQGFGRN